MVRLASSIIVHIMILEVTRPYIRPYIVQYLHFRILIILEYPFWLAYEAHEKYRYIISPAKTMVKLEL